MTFRPDTTFPFLKIARERNLHYGYVLYVADMIESGELWLPLGADLHAIDDAVLAERRRRATVAHNALHNGDAP